jgi:hypothetical protein
MSSNPRGSEDWRWAQGLRPENVGFATFNVMAVFPTLPLAERAVDGLRATGLGDDAISLRSRTLTDDPPAGTVEPPVEVPALGRDAQVAGGVAQKVILLSLVAAAGAAILGLLIALLAGFSTVVLVTTVVVAAVAGAVVGAVWGGMIGSMREAGKERGVVVGAHVGDRDAAVRAEAALRELQPLSFAAYDVQGRPIKRL